MNLTQIKWRTADSMEAWNFHKNSMDFGISKVQMSHRHIWLSFRLKNLLRFKVNIFNGIYIYIERESIGAHVKTIFFVMTYMRILIGHGHEKET